MTTFDVVWSDDRNALDVSRVSAVSAEAARQAVERRPDCAEVLLVDPVEEESA